MLSTITKGIYHLFYQYCTAQKKYCLGALCIGGMPQSKDMVHWKNKLLLCFS